MKTKYKEFYISQGEYIGDREQGGFYSSVLNTPFNGAIHVVEAQALQDAEARIAELEREVESLTKVANDLAQEVFLAKRAFRAGFQSYVRNEMKCRADDDCDHCVIESTLNEDANLIEVLKKEITYLNDKLAALGEDAKGK